MNPKLVLYNVRGLNSPYKRRALWKTAIDAKCDVLCVQETHFSSVKTPKFTHAKFLHVFTAKHASKKNGVLIAVKDIITFSLLQEHADPHRHSLILVAEMDHVTYTLVNLYAPNVRSLRFIRKVVRMAKKLQKGSLICGDFNMIMNTERDVSSVAFRRRPSLGSLCHKERLFDPLRCLKATEIHFSCAR